MTVVFLDGADGAGKTTLLRHIAHHHGGGAVIAPPLWHYLPSVPAPEAFAGWVTTTPPADVAIALLTAQRNRIATIVEGHAATAAVIVLVDRGPKTVEASARAHLASAPIPAPEIAMTNHVALLRQAVAALTHVRTCLSVELTASSIDDIFGRLTIREQRDGAYQRYLRVLLDKLATITHVDGVNALALPATDPLKRNTAAAIRALDRTP